MQLRHKSLLAAATATLALVAAGQAGAAGPWAQVGGDVKSGVSGLALTGHSDGTVHALIVRDNKKRGRRAVRLGGECGGTHADLGVGCGAADGLHVVACGTGEVHGVQGRGAGVCAWFA